ncbi:hypothetical protein FisN_11Lh106 [Fistulifera solaris]|uniref:Uncharacterized protein n=1 Tax=Fistulifera solaris TaxID=1519565 RepID=A0A1Z5J7I4_FISSO|nr:hypothetical protein FisN_11Lh106 [Fistulifera solaris]|eukprot:GAX09909.1 hypothetical protein FisN_11Lh106 [Fistulifera solaris]
MTTKLAEEKAYEWKDPLERKLGHLAATSLAENLSILYSSDEKREPSQETIDGYLRKIAEECQERRRCGDGSLPDEDFLTRVREDAVRLWKSNSVPLPELKTTAPSKPSQFSLLFGGASLGSFMSWERLVEESGESTGKRVQILLSLEYLQDILLDWDEHLAPFFLEGLRNELSSSSHDFFELHKRWFSKSRASNEFRTMQIGLCQNLVTVIDEQLASGIVLSTETNNTVRNYVELALLMFEDWMLRGVYVHDKRVQSIGECFWKWLEADAEGRMSVAGQSVVEVDPAATWFTSWNAHLSADQCLDIVLSGGGDSILSDAIRRCHEYSSKTELALSSDSADYRTFFFWVSIVHSILETTRAFRFPWNLVVKAPSLEEKHAIIINLYLHAIKHDHSDDRNAIAMIGDGIQTILVANKEVTGFLRETVSLFLENIKKDEIMNADRKVLIQEVLQQILQHHLEHA